MHQVWSHLVEPLIAELDDEQREQARTVASVSLIIWLISAGGFLYSLPALLQDGLLQALVIFAAICAFGVPYWLARRGQARLATLINTVIATASVFAAAVLLDGDLGYGALYYLVIVGIYAATFLSLHTAVVLTAVNLVLSLLVPTIFGLSLSRIINGSFAFNLIGMLFILLFVTYWRQREIRKRDALAVSEKRYRALSEHMSDYMFYARFQQDGERTIEWETDQFRALTGYASDELGKDTLFQLVLPQDHPQVLEGRRQIRRGEPTDETFRITRKDGTVRWLKVERIPVTNDADRLIGYYGIVIDITEAKLAQEQQEELRLQRAQFEVVDSFVKAISHDFRNRLSAIETTRHLIGREVGSETLTRIQPRLERIESHIHDMVIQLTNLSMVSTLSHPQMGALDINRLCERLQARYSSQAVAKGLCLPLELPEMPLVILGDASQIERALEHLLGNALAHTTAGTIWLRAYRKDAWVCIEVEDTGVGIPEEKLPYIFQPFFRADDARTVTVGGVGLGLTIVKLIMETHHGSIDAESRVNQGSLFRIRIPQLVNSNV